MSILKSVPLAAGVLVASAGMAAAQTAVVTNDLNLRAGPGTQYGIVASMPAGAAVNLGACQAGWCAVNWAGRSGYASSRYLDVAGVAPQRRFATAPRARLYAGPYPRYGYDRAWHPRYGWYDRRYAGPGVTLRFGDRGGARFGW